MAFGDPQPPSPDKGHGSAKGILTQIKGLLHQYIDLGDSTPLKGEADSFLKQVEDGLDSLDSGGAPAPGSEPKPSPASDFRGATKAASDAMKADGSYVKNQGQPKAPSDMEDEQAEADEEKKKKGTKAFPS